jgi:hypothetical protein
MKSAALLRVVAVVCALFASEIALAAPPTEVFDTDCFSVKLPKGRFKQFRRNKLDNARPYLGSWGFGNQDATIKLYIRCTSLLPGNIQLSLARSMPHLLKRIRSWQPLEKPTVEKDEKGRPIISVVGQGRMPILDKKTGQIGLATQLVARTLMHYPQRRLQVSITAIVAHARARELGDLMAVVGDSFDLIDLKEKAALKAKAALAAKAAVPAKKAIPAPLKNVKRGGK